MTRSLVATLALLVFVAPLRGDPNDAGSRGFRDITREEAATALEHVYRGHPHAALDYLKTLKLQCDDHPLYMLMRARALQEFVPMDDLDTDAARELAKPALEQFDRVIAVCNDELDQGDDPIYLLYRGWAWIGKSYVRSMTRHMWPAAREAKKGQADLKKYLALHPDDPTANGLLGSFLYFADIVPSIFKWISRVLPLIPSGDRQEGLQRLQRSVTGDALLTVDYELILYNVYFYFEGRIEDGVSGLEKMNKRYPEYTRTAIPLAVARLYMPTLVADLEQRVEDTVQRIYAGPNREVDWNSFFLLRSFQAYADHYCDHTRLAIARLNGLAYEKPLHPDWVGEFAQLELGAICAEAGKRAEAEKFLSPVAQDGAKSYRNQAQALLSDLETIVTPQPPLDSRWIHELYHGKRDSLSAYRDRFAARASASGPATFYYAECQLLLGECEDALTIYDGLLQADEPAWVRVYQMLAATRMAEIHAMHARYSDAVRYQKESLKLLRGEYLLDWVQEGRLRYFEQLSEGNETKPPSLLLTVPHVCSDPGAGSGGN